MGTKKRTSLGRIQHSSYTSGAPVKSAGWMRFNKQGELVEIANFSGHYRPGKQQVHKLLLHLNENGVDLSSVRLSYSAKGKASDGYIQTTVSAWLEENNLSL